MARSEWEDDDYYGEPELDNATRTGQGGSLFTDRTDRWVQAWAHAVGAVLVTVLASHYVETGLLSFVPVLYLIGVAYVYTWLDERKLRKELDSLTASR